MKRYAVGILTLTLALYGATGARAQFPTTNLLTNPGAETGTISGWTVGGVSNPGVDNGSFDPGINPNSGNFDFFGNNGLQGTLTQNVVLLGNQGITAAQLDSGTLFVTVSFFEQGLDQGTPSDDGQIVLTFRDALSAVIGAPVSTPEVDSHDGTWQNLTQSFAIPVGTRSIDYQMTFLRHVGSDNDSFIDDNSLTITQAAAAAPEPGSLALLTLAGLPFLRATIARRKKSLK